jgi:uncharacterized protein YPO0396
MLSLFSTSSDKAGFRLQYMEVFNWGTFHEKIFRINPQGNNSLLTGANASGKSTFIDALLTLLVPVKKDRFYNQSSGVEKKGDRTEETYVCGHYGNIQREGELSTTTQTLRGKDTYSVLLASFSNTDQKTITLFQVRWFASDGKLNRAFGIAYVPLEIEKDFSQFDGKGNWKKRLDKTYNSNSNKKKIELFDGPTSYGERISNVFGMRSIKGLSLFNQVVGVKVLEDLDEFIRTNMLEEYKEDNENAEEKFIKLKSSFETLIDAKTNIEKAKEQIEQLTPINEIAIEISNIQGELKTLDTSKEIAVYWFAKKSVELFELELGKSNIQLGILNDELLNLKAKETELKGEETDLTVQIKTDEVGNQIEKLKTEIGRLEKLKDARASKLDEYNIIATRIELSPNPNIEIFKKNRESAKSKKNDYLIRIETETENQRKLKNEEERLVKESEEIVTTIQALQKNKNNISGRVAEIREDIIAFVGATKEEIPFIGELIKVREEEKEWELSIEKILHNFALRLIVPEKYYYKVNEYVNKENLRGRIRYDKFERQDYLKNFKSKDFEQNSLINKVEIKSKTVYNDYLEDCLSNQFNFNCVDSLSEFDRFREMVVTKNGLTKFKKGRHEKDDRPDISKKENYVLGWDNREKIAKLKKDLIAIQTSQGTNKKDLTTINTLIKSLGDLKDDCFSIFSTYTKYDDIDWQTYASQIQDKEDAKKTLEATNDRVQALQKQLSKVQEDLKKLADVDIWNKGQEIFQLGSSVETIGKDLEANTKLIEPHGFIDTTEFEKSNPELLNVIFSTIKETQTKFQNDTTLKGGQLNKRKGTIESEVRIKINAFKQPDESITKKFKDWRSDVSRLPDSTNLDLIEEYQTLFQKMKQDDLPRFQKDFDKHIIGDYVYKIGSFNTFFNNWKDAIKENIDKLNSSLKEIDFKSNPTTFIQIIASNKVSDEVIEFKKILDNAIPNIKELDSIVDGRRIHFENNIQPFFEKLEKEEWRNKVMEVRSWYSYKAEEFYKETNQKFKTYENMGQLSGGEKAQLTYTILGSAIAYQFGLTKEGLQTNSFRFIAIDEAFKAQDEDKARYLITLCKQLHLQLLVVTPSDNIHIVEDAISFVHFVERKDEKYSWLYDMPIEQFKEERENFINK